MKKQWQIDKKYKDLVNRYKNETNTARKIEMKYKYIEWMKVYSCELTEAEIEFLEKEIAYVEDLHNY